MKVLHINHNDRKGGAAIAAYRHHDAMKQMGIDSRMLVLEKYSQDSNVIPYSQNKIKKIFFKIWNRIMGKYYNFFSSWSWNLFGYDLSNNIEIDKADIIVIHWVNQYMISLKSIEKIIKKGKPVFWFMHDMWPITGGCHYAFECDKYTTHCNGCILMHNRQGSKKIKDISYFQFEEKLKKIASYDNLKFITPSKWLYDKVKSSRIGRNHDVMLARNILNTHLFSPKNKTESRIHLGLPINQKLILFGADNITSPYKGWNYLKEALNDMPDNVSCVVYGSSNKNEFEDINVNIFNMGTITDTDKLIDLYSACDVFVTPSLADNYPNVLIEAMACGLVCVGFNTGGIPEIIENGKNGLIVDKYDSICLRKGIIQVLDDSNYSIFSKNAAKSIRENNSYSNIIPVV